MNAVSIAIANSTSRSAGAVGRNAIVPRYVASIAKPDQTILDFGAGKKAIHTQELRAKGLNVTAWDFGDNFDPTVHHYGALWGEYDIVFLSNVINVVDTEDALWQTLVDAFTTVKPGGRMVLNYPESPRKMALSTGAMQEYIEQGLRRYLLRVGSTKRVPIWEVIK